MLKKIKVYSILTIIASLITGVLFIIFPVNATRFAAYLIAVTMLVLGIYDLYLYYKEIGYTFYYRNNLFAAILKLLIGIAMLLNIDLAISLFGVMFAIFVISSSANTFEESIIIKRAGLDGWLVTLLLSIATMICGISMMLVPFETANTLAIYAGIVLIVNAINGIITLVKVAKIKKEFFDVYEIDNHLRISILLNIKL